MSGLYERMAKPAPPLAPVAALVLAAGRSSRMGAFKPLLPLGEATVLERAIRAFRGAGIDEVYVVIGYRAEELLPIVERLEAKPIRNERYEEGMFSSVLAGLRALANSSEAFFLLPVDTPLVEPSSIGAMLRTREESGAAVVYPVFRGRRGHPPLVSRSCYPDILSFGGQGGLRAALRRFDASAAEVELHDAGIVLDIDTPGDYEALKDYFAHRGVPSEEALRELLSSFEGGR
jgi:molybdenum cofactor cytidylyltransferase